MKDCGDKLTPRTYCLIRLVCVTICSFGSAAFAWFFTMYELGLVQIEHIPHERLTPGALFFQRCSLLGFCIPVLIILFGVLALRFRKTGILFELITGLGAVVSFLWIIFCVVAWLSSFIPDASPLNRAIN